MNVDGSCWRLPRILCGLRLWQHRQMASHFWAEETLQLRATSSRPFSRLFWCKLSWMRRIGCLLDKYGLSCMRNTHVKVEDVYQALARRVWVQGRGLTAGANTKEAFKHALRFLQESSPELLNDYRKTNLIHRKFFRRWAFPLHWTRRNHAKSAIEGRSDRNMALPSGSMIPTGDPFLAFTRTHNTANNMGETTQTAGIVEEWLRSIQRLWARSCCASRWAPGRCVRGWWGRWGNPLSFRGPWRWHCN